MNDAELIQATLAGDTAAFGDLVRAYQDRLFNSLVHVVRCPEEAQDVVQDAFVQAFTKLSTFKGTSAFYTWLYRIAFNVSISRRRKRRPSVSLEHGKDEMGAEPAAALVPDRMELTERAAQLNTALEALTEEHRTVLILREMEDCSYEEIAEMLDLPIGTVRSRLHRARMDLREHLKEVMQED
ncbi:MAG: sigma-70 family RNA polymerase sigma factor [Pirellulales bacterium]|nr:sigma-70 family RNA polymerase sigma factor [Pirellulales bacterium]